MLKFQKMCDPIKPLVHYVNARFSPKPKNILSDNCFIFKIFTK